VAEPGKTKKGEPNALYDGLVTAERSVFGTRLPRPTGVGRHLVVVGFLSLLALGIAVYLAERGARAPEATPATTKFKR
jgi:hypothetical protein